MASVVEGFLIDEDFQMVLLRNSLDIKGKKDIAEHPFILLLVGFD